MTVRSVKEIRIGDRDREPGDVSDLMESMTEVGLLHPVVVTPDNLLVAGGRRLAAAKRLGWTEVDVTVIATLADANLALRAEKDENTCRRDLSPVEAERARARRAKVLAPLAREAQARPGKARSSKLDKHAGPTRKVAAQGTGYSGTTLDKVAKVREVAEDEAQPEPVRDVAREALTRLSEPNVPVDPAFRDVQRAVEAASEPTVVADPGAEDRAYLRAYDTALGRAHHVLTDFDPERLGPLLTAAEVETLRHLRTGLDSFISRIDRSRSGLRVVKDGS